MREKIAEGKEVIEFLVNLKDLEVTDKLPEECNNNQYVKGEENELKGCIPSKLDEETYLEALAREIIRRVQVMRNKADLQVDEFINVYIETPDEDLKKVVEELGDYISNEVRAKELTFSSPTQCTLVMDWRVEGKPIKICIERVS